MNSKTFTVLLLLSIFAINGPVVKSAKILAIYAFPGKSHFMMHTTIIKELLQRGHQVTMVTAFTLNPKNLGSNYTEILIEPVYNFWDDVKEIFDADTLFDLTSMDLFDFLKMLKLIGTKTTEHALKQPKVKALINAQETDGVYDLLLSEQFYQEAFLAFSYKFNIPVVTSSTLGYENHMSQMMGIITPWSFVPHGFLPFTDEMSFSDRLLNSFYSLYEDYDREFNYFPMMDKLVEEHFGHLGLDLPKVSRMEKNISLMLLNSHGPLTTVRPTADTMIPVGGMHIYPPQPLSPDIKKFLDEATHGVIYFSLGSNVQSKDMPMEKLNIFLNVFSKLKQRVLWKFESENITNLPQNVMIKSWLPQSDILAHQNVKVFITHGGLLGTQEGVHYGVPMLGMPFYCDQHLNINKAVLGGYAIGLNFQSITRELLMDSLQQLLENPVYLQNIQRISRIFRDRPMNPRDTAMFWIEYVIRHKGASHLRSAGLDLPWYKFYLLDVIAFVILAPLAVLYICNKNANNHKRRRQTFKRNKQKRY